jgi:hypothetical protein
MGFNQISQPEEQPTAIRGVHRAIRRCFQCVPGRFDRPVYVGSASLGNAGDNLPSGRLECVETGAIMRIDPLIVDEQACLPDSRHC